MSLDIIIFIINNNKKKFLKFWWNEELDLLKEDSIQSDKLWKAVGKPRSGQIFNKRQTYRARYRKRIREYERASTEVYTNYLHESLLRKNNTDFWNAGIPNSNI